MVTHSISSYPITHGWLWLKESFGMVWKHKWRWLFTLFLYAFMFGILLSALAYPVSLGMASLVGKDIQPGSFLLMLPELIMSVLGILLFIPMWSMAKKYYEASHHISGTSHTSRPLWQRLLFSVLTAVPIGALSVGFSYLFITMIEHIYDFLGNTLGPPHMMFFAASFVFFIIPLMIQSFLMIWLTFSVQLVFFQNADPWDSIVTAFRGIWANLSAIFVSFFGFFIVFGITLSALVYGSISSYSKMEALADSQFSIGSSQDYYLYFIWAILFIVVLWFLSCLGNCLTHISWQKIFNQDASSKKH